MKIGLFFGSFNPIHTGHLIIANHIANFFTQEVWFVVTPQNPFKNVENLLEGSKRLKFTQLAINGDPRFKVKDLEFDLPKPSYTFLTLQKLSEIYPNDEFFLIIGSDNLKNLYQWKNGYDIVNNNKILVYERPGYQVSESSLHSNIQIVQSELLDISSTRIRDLIKQGKNIRYLVPEPVRKEIESENLYR